MGNLDLLDIAVDKMDELPNDLISFGISLMQDGEIIDLIVELNKSQIADGRKPDGTEISRTDTGAKYRPYTIEVKKTKSGLSGVYDHVTLYDTGAFYEGIAAKVGSTEIEVIGNDSKTEKLLSEWGNVFGLTDLNMVILIDAIFEHFISFANNFSVR